MDGELQILFVLAGERRHPHRDAGQIDALVFAQHAAVDHLALRVLSVDGQYVEFNQAVGEQDACAWLQIFRECWKGGGDQGRGPGDIAGRNGQSLASLELHRDTVLEPPGAYLRSLQIAQDTNRFRFFARYLTHHFDQLQFFRMGAVGKVEPGHIQPGADQLPENRFGITGRAQGGHNFGPAALVRPRSIVGCRQGKTHSSLTLARPEAVTASGRFNSTRTAGQTIRPRF